MNKNKCTECENFKFITDIMGLHIKCLKNAWNGYKFLPRNGKMIKLGDFRTPNNCPKMKK